MQEKTKNYSKIIKFIKNLVHYLSNLNLFLLLCLI